MRQCDINDQPQEVLDAFIDELANDIASLKACSLVSRRWFWRSRKHLFKRVRFSSMRGSKSLRNWSAVMNPSGTKLVQTRFLITHRVHLDSPASFTTSLRISQREEAWMSPLTLARYFVHFRLFDRVESLTLSHFSCRTFGQNSLRVLLHNLTLSVRKLCLHHPTACPDSLLGFISIFTNLQETMIRAPRWIFTKYLGAHTTTFHALKGELRLSELDRGSGPFLSLIGSQETRYEKVTLKNCRFREFHPLQQLVSGVAATLRRLDVVAEGDRKFGTPPLIWIILKERTLFRRSQRSSGNLLIRLCPPGISCRQCGGTRGAVLADQFHDILHHLPSLSQVRS